VSSSTPMTVTATMRGAVIEGFDAESMFVRRASLEDVFLILTGRSLED